MKRIDAFIAMGGGERELMIGEGERGKRCVAMDRMVKEKDEEMMCMYVAMGEKE
ncbi:hypothetical protein [Bacillus altitudinis]|uniref:hypothetical protein n=1 Tax=Bacillus altitudinis TaxID=293387 RepID=UPI003B52DE0A